MKFYKSLTGATLAIIYIIFALSIATGDFNCGKTDNIDGFNFCGLATSIITFPSLLTVGLVLDQFGIKVNHRTAPSILDIFLVALHIGITSIVIYGIGYGIEWIVRRLIKIYHSNKSRWK